VSFSKGSSITGIRINELQLIVIRKIGFDKRNNLMVQGLSPSISCSTLYASPLYDYL